MGWCCFPWPSCADPPAAAASASGFTDRRPCGTTAQMTKGRLHRGKARVGVVERPSEGNVTGYKPTRVPEASTASDNRQRLVACRSVGCIEWRQCLWLMGTARFGGKSIAPSRPASVVQDDKFFPRLDIDGRDARGELQPPSPEQVAELCQRVSRHLGAEGMGQRVCPCRLAACSLSPAPSPPSPSSTLSPALSPLSLLFASSPQ